MNFNSLEEDEEEEDVISIESSKRDWNGLYWTTNWNEEQTNKSGWT